MIRYPLYQTRSAESVQAVEDCDRVQSVDGPLPAASHILLTGDRLIHNLLTNGWRTQQKVSKACPPLRRAHSQQVS